MRLNTDVTEAVKVNGENLEGVETNLGGIITTKGVPLT